VTVSSRIGVPLLPSPFISSSIPPLFSARPDPAFFQWHLRFLPFRVMAFLRMVQPPPRTGAPSSSFVLLPVCLSAGAFFWALPLFQTPPFLMCRPFSDRELFSSRSSFFDRIPSAGLLALAALGHFFFLLLPFFVPPPGSPPNCHPAMPPFSCDCLPIFPHKPPLGVVCGGWHSTCADVGSVELHAYTLVTSLPYSFLTGRREFSSFLFASTHFTRSAPVVSHLPSPSNTVPPPPSHPPPPPLRPLPAFFFF